MHTKDPLFGSSSLCSQFQSLRSAYLHYGLYLLNRVGMHDDSRSIYPENEIQAAGRECLMYRSYLEFTSNRLAMTKSAPKSLTKNQMGAHQCQPSANNSLTNWRYLTDQKPDKRPHEIGMFWFLGSYSEQHEPLSDTIERQVLRWLPFNLQAESSFSPSGLMTFIRKGEPHPYNWEWPPPRVQCPTSTDLGFQKASVTSPVGSSSAISPN